MDILPAIDLRDGMVVRLQKGDYDRQTVYSDDSVSVANSYIKAGSGWIHIVDLDAALSGELTNTVLLRNIARIASENGVRIQNGGGIRSRERIDMLLEAGVARLVIGSAALKNWEWFEGLLLDDSLPNNHLALGLDTRDGRVAAEGWTEQLETTAIELADRVNGSGLGAIVYTDISRDGMLEGLDIQGTENVINATDVPVIASGGVKDLGDIVAAGKIGCAGVILGKALYEKRVDLGSAIDTARGAGSGEE